MNTEKNSDNDTIHELELRIGAMEAARKSDVRLIGTIVTTSSALVGVIAYLFFSFIDQRIPPGTNARVCDASRKASMSLHQFYDFHVEYLEAEKNDLEEDIKSMEGVIEAYHFSNTDGSLESTNTVSTTALTHLRVRRGKILSEINKSKYDKGQIEHLISVCSEPST